MRWKPSSKMNPRSKGPYMFSKYIGESKNTAVIFNMKNKNL